VRVSVSLTRTTTTAKRVGNTMRGMNGLLST